MLQLTLRDFQQQFGNATERRVELYEVFQEWITAAQSASLLKQVWVFGSFVSKKAGPNNLDIVALFVAEFDVSVVEVPLRHWFDHELCRQLHEIEFFMKETSPPELRTMILDTFGRSRDGQESIVQGSTVEMLL